MILTYDVGGDYFRTDLSGGALELLRLELAVIDHAPHKLAGLSGLLGRGRLLLLGHGHRNAAQHAASLQASNLVLGVQPVGNLIENLYQAVLVG